VAIGYANAITLGMTLANSIGLLFLASRSQRLHLAMVILLATVTSLANSMTTIFVATQHVCLAAHSRGFNMFSTTPSYSMTDQDYLTIIQAAKYVGTSDRTIRRRIEDITKGVTETAAADRFHILPTAKEKEGGSKDPWRINKALLHQLFPDAGKQKTEGEDKESVGTVDRLLAILEKQASTLDSMIEKVEIENKELKGELKTANGEIESLKQKLLPAGELHKQEETKPAESEPQKANQDAEGTESPKLIGSVEEPTEPTEADVKTKVAAEQSKERATKGILKNIKSYFVG